MAGKLPDPIPRLGLRLIASARSLTSRLLELVLQRCPLRYLGRLLAGPKCDFFRRYQECIRVLSWLPLFSSFVFFCLPVRHDGPGFRRANDFHLVTFHVLRRSYGVSFFRDYRFGVPNVVVQTFMVVILGLREGIACVRPSTFASGRTTLGRVPRFASVTLPELLFRNFRGDKDRFISNVQGTLKRAFNGNDDRSLGVTNAFTG